MRPINGIDSKHSEILVVRNGTLIVLAFSAALLLPCPTTAAEPQRPNVVFVLVDDVGYGDLGCTGAKDIRTPHIDRLAKEGVRFTDFYANGPVCTPTRVALMTGRWQQRVGLEWAMGFTAEQFRRVEGKWVKEPDKLALGLPVEETSIARLLKEEATPRLPTANGIWVSNPNIVPTSMVSKTTSVCCWATPTITTTNTSMALTASTKTRSR